MVEFAMQGCLAFSTIAETFKQVCLIVSATTDGMKHPCLNKEAKSLFVLGSI
ncbi:hypothetical protein [Carboxylicivirga linearis]|uniref:hypothetical protein n=1 Tax=Carboxylicivirga linearis TaxID=1628157 RepID=UPI001BAC61E7|nr:hypothetical protein [Carboxylicivirga linearis]